MDETEEKGEQCCWVIEQKNGRENTKNSVTGQEFLL